MNHINSIKINWNLFRKLFSLYSYITLLFCDFSFNFYHQKEERWYALNRWYTCNYHAHINVRCSYISCDAHSLLPEIVERVKAYQSRRFIQFTNDRSAGKTSIFRSVDKFRIGIFVHLIGSLFRFISVPPSSGKCECLCNENVHKRFTLCSKIPFYPIFKFIIYNIYIYIYFLRYIYENIHSNLELYLFVSIFISLKNRRIL